MKLPIPAFILSGLLAGSTVLAAAELSPLEQGFLNPPDSARPWAYYFVMDGNLTTAGITADFEALQGAGIGGVLMMEVDVGIPPGPVKFMSPEWRQMFKHAVVEAERLGLQLSLNAGPGWTGSGGPWVKPEQSMQHLVASALEVAGPKPIDEVLPRPQRWPAFFGDGHLPPELEKVKNNFYRDVVVLAFPAPAGKERIADIAEKAFYVRAPYSSQPGVKSCLPAPAAFPTLPPESVIALDRILDLTANLEPDGRLVWKAPAGNWTILRFGRTSTGATTRPAPRPGLGLESDKLDKAALDAHFDAFVGALLRDVGPRSRTADAGWTMLHIDSWEMGAQNWTGAFRDEFKQRRGYDPLPYLPAMTGRVVGSLEVSERFLWDLRETVQELTIENHAQHLKALGRRHRFGLSIEPYDMMPCSDMRFGAVADVPMCEFWTHPFNTTYSVIEAASIAHTVGRNVVAAEAFTSDDTERWQAHPASMKTLGDWAFCAGVNRFVFHRSQHQPWLDRSPGMTFGPYGVHWERTQTWWSMVGAYHTYLARCQFLLQQGLPVADLCYLLAEGAPQVFRPPASATRGYPPERLGYNFDGCTPDVLMNRMSVAKGRLVLPDGMSYRVLVLPERHTMTPSLLRKVKDLVRAGGIVVGPPPEKSPSLSGYPRCDDEVRTLAEELWGPAFAAITPGPSNSIGQVTRCLGRGRITWPRSVSTGLINPDRSKLSGLEPEQYADYTIAKEVLNQMGVSPDFESDGPISYTHRHIGQTELYFVANREQRVVEANCSFRVSGKAPELWDPLTGERRDLPVFTSHGPVVAVPIRFEPAQSYFVVFRKPVPRSRSAAANFPPLIQATELSGSWELAFDPKWGGPEKVTFEHLEDWSQRPEEAIKFYSGTALYRKTFELQVVPGSQRVCLDLGAVRNLAQVRLNGRDLGVVWCAPWRVDITKAIQPGANQLEVKVANLWPNRLIGDTRLPPEKRFTWTTWNPFTPDSPLSPSGLLGPVTIQTINAPGSGPKRPH